MKVSYLAIALAVGSSAPAFAQATPSYSTPHTSWGAPDLGGFWTNASLTTMQRPNGATSLVVDDREADRLQRSNVYSAAAREESGRSKVDEASSRQLLSDKNSSRAYNRFWMDPGTTLAKVKGEYRTSWITTTPDGRIPYSADGLKANTTRRGDFSGPEVRPLSERCLMSFTGSYGPVLNNGMYNNNYQIVQTPGSVMILTEMIHDVKVIPIADKKPTHGPGEIPRWGGDSVGWYEGDTLVVETINSHPKQRSYISAKGKVTERFTRYSDGQIFYEFTVDDPSLYTTAWGGEMSLNASREPLYEYACHEGNYALGGILAGARQRERDGREDPPVLPIFAGVDVSDGE
jgi:hypothetical protein